MALISAHSTHDSTATGWNIWAGEFGRDVAGGRGANGDTGDDGNGDVQLHDQFSYDHLQPGSFDRESHDERTDAGGDRREYVLSRRELCRHGNSEGTGRRLRAIAAVLAACGAGVGGKAESSLGGFLWAVLAVRAWRRGATPPGDYQLVISATINGQTVSVPPVVFHVN